jgi:hypothetical protein
MALDENITHKAAGDPIKSADWNALAAETNRLDAAKLDTVGGTLSGLLTAAGGLSTPSLFSPTVGIQLLKPADGSWSHQAGSGNVMVIDQRINLERATSILALGHGHGSTQLQNENHRLVLDIAVDGAATALNQEGTNPWGVGLAQSVPSGLWVPIITVGSCQLAAGTHRFQLRIRNAADSPGGFVYLNGATLWLAFLGAA